VDTLFVVLAGYALGCLVGAYYVVRLRSGGDVRASGSGNAGARNVLRGGDRRGAAITLLWDIAKGAAAVAIARAASPHDWAMGLAFVAVIAGHIWPAQLRFHGGKGVATALGCMLVLDPRVTVAALATGALLVGLTRSPTAGGLTAIAVTPVIVALTGAVRPC
jgi:glycerol-3-phosphate acyltransferase PlsY